MFNNRLTIHEATKLTNTTLPVKDYLTKDTFPEQDSDKLGTEVIIKYRDFKRHNTDDTEPFRYRVREAKMYILRYDIVAPYLVIGVIQEGSIDKGSIIVIKRLEDELDLDNYIAVYPDQKYNYYINYTKDVYIDYSKIEDGFDGTIIRCDAAEPAFAVIAEIDLNDKLRFIIADEAICTIENYPPTSITHDEEDVYELLVNLLGAHELYGK